MVTSWLARSPPDRAVWSLVLCGDILQPPSPGLFQNGGLSHHFEKWRRPWERDWNIRARDFTLTVPLVTQVNRWIPASLPVNAGVQGVTLR